MAFENRALVIDNGSLCSKAGFAGNDVPKAIFSTALRRAGHQNLDSPMDQGIVRDWASMEMVWNHTFNDQLCVDPTKQPVLLTESPFNPRQNREKTAEIMFETFDVPALCITNQAVLSLYAAGLTTGTVVDCGDSVTFVAPVHEGRTIPRMVHRLDMAGRTVDQTLDALLKPFSHLLDASPQSGVVRSVKEELCFVAQDFDEEAKNSRSSQQTKTFALPDGQKITLNDERFRAPEVLFKPALFSQESQAIHEATNYAISRCDVDVRPDLYRNVVLTGGTSALDGFTGRMQIELMTLAPRNTTVRVVASPASKHAAWTGGSIFAALPTFTNSCVTREEFAEHGAEIFENKCAVIA